MIYTSEVSNGRLIGREWIMCAGRSQGCLKVGALRIIFFNGKIRFKFEKSVNKISF